MRPSSPASKLSAERGEPEVALRHQRIQVGGTETGPGPVTRRRPERAGRRAPLPMAARWIAPLPAAAA
jgi:hypothetical protein